MLRTVFPALKRRAIFGVSLRDAEANPTGGYESRIERHPQQTVLAFRARNIEIRRRYDANRYDPSNRACPTSDLRLLTSDF